CSAQLYDRRHRGENDLTIDGDCGERYDAELDRVVDTVEDIYVTPLKVLYRRLCRCAELRLSIVACETARAIEQFDLHAHCTDAERFARSSAAMIVHSFTGCFSFAHSAIN